MYISLPVTLLDFTTGDDDGNSSEDPPHDVVCPLRLAERQRRLLCGVPRRRALSTFDVTEVKTFLHHWHIIPISRGYLREWMREHGKGWESNSLRRALERANVLEPTSGGVHPGRQPIRDLIEVTLVSPAEATMVDPPPPIPKVVTGPKFCQTCGRPYDVVLPWYGVYCGVHRGYREPRGETRFDWRTGRLLGEGTA